MIESGAHYFFHSIMKNGFFFVSLLLFIGFSVVPCRADGPEWIEIKSPHFSVATDAGEKRGREVAMRFEQMRSVFANLMVKANVNIPVPLQIVAFRNSKELRQCSPMFRGKPTQLAGLFQSGQDRSFILLDLSLPDPWSVVFHEYAHQLMNGTVSFPLDPWFEEGFAEYFASIEVDDKQARIGKIPHQTYLVLQQYSLMKVSDLLQVRHYSETYNESGERRSVFYAESRMLVHYLYDNQLIPKLSTYFDLRINQRASLEQAVHDTFGMNVADLDKTLQDYIRSRRYKYYAIPTPADIVTNGYSTTPLTTADAAALIADVHLHQRDYRDKAIPEFQDALKIDPNNAMALRGLGFAYIQTGKLQEAKECLEHAAQLNSKDPRVHYYTALLLNRQSGSAEQFRRPQVIQELQTAIALDPSFADPYILLGAAQAASGNPAQGLETMKKGLSLNPRNEFYQFNVAEMYITNKRYDEGVALLHYIEKNQNPLLAVRVQEALVRAERMRTGHSTAAAETPMLRLRESSDRKVEGDSVATNPAEPLRQEPGAKGAQPRQLPAPKIELIKNVRGILTQVECSSDRSAILRIVSEEKTIKMRVWDINNVIVFGADKFSCAWTNQKISVNYNEGTGGDLDGRVVSLEIQ